MANKTYMIIGMKKRGESQVPKHSFFFVLDFVEGIKEAKEKFEDIKKSKRFQYDGFILASINTLTFCKKSIDLVDINPDMFNFMPTYETGLYNNVIEN